MSRRAFAHVVAAVLGFVAGVVVLLVLHVGHDDEALTEIHITPTASEAYARGWEDASRAAYAKGIQDALHHVLGLDIRVTPDVMYDGNRLDLHILARRGGETFNTLDQIRDSITWTGGD